MTAPAVNESQHSQSLGLVRKISIFFSVILKKPLLVEIVYIQT